MRVVLTLGGETAEVEVDLAAGTVTVGGRVYPFRVVTSSPGRTELEIGDERAVVAEWPTELAIPPPRVDVNGERWPVELRIEASPTTRVPERPAPPAGLPRVAPPAEARDAGGEGVPVVPPMPGRVLEIRVHEGDRVEAGQLLLVLEAMKMRNEVTSPRAGRISSLRTSAGANARAGEPLLWIVPE